MKQLFFLFLIFSLPVSVFPQAFNGGITAGLSTSQVSGDDQAGFHKVGFAGGAFVNYEFNEKWSLQLEMLFVQKGSQKNPNPENFDYITFSVDLAYVEVPVFARYKVKRFIFDLGLYFGRLIWDRQRFLDLEQDVIGKVEKWEFGFNVGVSYYLWKTLGVSWRLSNSIAPIKEKPIASLEGGSYNTVMAFSLFYQFKGKGRDEND